MASRLESWGRDRVGPPTPSLGLGICRRTELASSWVASARSGSCARSLVSSARSWVSGSTRSSWPRSGHWRLLRRSERISRVWGGALIGFLVVALAPVLLGAEIPDLERAVGLSGQSQAVSVAHQTYLVRILLFSLLFGFSQDAFLRRLRQFDAAERKS